MVEKSTTAAVLLQRIRNLTKTMLMDRQHGRIPRIAFKKSQTYCELRDCQSNCFCSSLASHYEVVISIDKKGTARRMVVMLRVLQIIQLLLQEGKHASKRDVYYTDPLVFRDQAMVDYALSDICFYLHCSRHSLNVVSPSKGLVMGWLQFFERGRHIDCSKNLDGAFPVPMHIEDVQCIMSFAKYILVVEKEAVFERLSNDGFCKKHRCIILTGKGYPDVSTRRFLKLLIDQLNLPAYALMDCDPYGFDILATYRFGSKKMSYDVEELSTPGIRWLGGFLSDITNFRIPEHCLLPLTESDKRKTERMLKRCYLQQEAPGWRSELHQMWIKGSKFEIEAISSLSLSTLSEEYIPSKINAGMYI